MSYTSGGTMSAPRLRDVERWKEKVEIRLDNRQVFFLFFGSALVACLLFILGVIIGKRLESRGRAEAPPIEDPLALLDRVAASPGGAALTFPKTLLGPKPASPVAAKAPAPVKAVPQAGPKTIAAAPPPGPLEMKPAAAPPAPDSKAPAAPVAAKEDGATGEPSAASPKPTPSPAAAPAAPKDAVGAPAAYVPGAPAPANRYTLQLSSFQKREEAEAFARRFSGSYVVESNIPDKGLWFRVRVGSYGSSTEALRAKEDFERQHGVIAYLVGPK